MIENINVCLIHLKKELISYDYIGVDSCTSVQKSVRVSLEHG